MQALEVYRSSFRPSAMLQRPHAIVGLQLIAAPTDEEAEFLASSTYQRVLGILTGNRRPLQPPVERFWDGVGAQARAGIADFLAASVVGGPETVRAGLQRLADLTEADEFMLVSDVYEPALRLRSIEIAAAAVREAPAPAPVPLPA